MNKQEEILKKLSDITNEGYFITICGENYKLVAKLQDVIYNPEKTDNEKIDIRTKTAILYFNNTQEKLYLTYSWHYSIKINDPKLTIEKSKDDDVNDAIDRLKRKALVFSRHKRTNQPHKITRVMKGLFYKSDDKIVIISDINYNDEEITISDAIEINCESFRANIFIRKQNSKRTVTFNEFMELYPFTSFSYEDDNLKKIFNYLLADKKEEGRAVALFRKFLYHYASQKYQVKK